MIFVSLGLTFVAILFFVKYTFSYWKRKGYPYLKPSIPFGNMITFVQKEQSFTISVANLYNKTDDPFVGIYLFFRPGLLIRDAGLVKRILCDDFASFHDRGFHNNEKVNPLSANLSSLEGKKWRDMRSIISPAFTPSKLKLMFSTMKNVANIMEQYLIDNIPHEGKIVQLNKLTTRYANDTIVSTFFGVEVNSFKDDKHIFNKMRKELFSKGFLRNLYFAAGSLAPNLFEWLQLYRLDSWLNENLIKIVEDTINYRDQMNEDRKDFMQLLIQVRNTGAVKDDGDWSAKSDNDAKKTLSIEQIAAQFLLFLIAGLDTTSATISFCLYELTQNEDVMQKLMVDINQTLEKHNGEITYDSIQDMKYLELVLMETLRKYPTLPILQRVCTKNFQIPDSNLTIEKGTPIIISILGLQRDPKYFPDPMKFDPERFSDENKNYNPNAYIPFGAGPRACIGLQQGKLNAKVALVKILNKFKLEALEKRELEFDIYGFTLFAKGGIKIILKPT